MMTYKLALILFLVVASQAQTEKPSTVLCHSKCNKFFNNNNNIFTSEVDMAKNLTKIGFYSTSYVDVVDHFGFYSSAFKQKQLATLLAHKETLRYRNRSITAYGATQINDYIGTTYPDGTCPLCSTLQTENGGVPPYPNMFEDYVFAETLTEELDAASFMLNIPISKFPLFQFSRLLQPGVISIPQFAQNEPVCPDEVQNLVQLTDCFFGFQIIMEQAYLLFQNEYQLSNEQQININPNVGLAEDLTPGFANLIINYKYQEEMLAAYMNCLNNIHEDC